jgi:hypothetical protein
MVKEKIYHFIYKTTNLKNCKFYIGMHSTNDLNDGYLGSGKHLRNSVYYHGKDNFKREILEFLSDRISLKEREKEIVNTDLLKEEKCMNLKEGGEGGGGLWNEEHARNFHVAGGKAVRILLSKRHHEKLQNDIEYRKKIIQKLRGNKNWEGKHHKESSKKLIGEKNSINQLGNSNSQYGTCWITNGEENKKVKKIDFQVYENEWKLGRVIKK